MSIWSNISRRLRDINRARFEVDGHLGNVLRYGVGDTGFNIMGDMAFNIGKQVIKLPYKFAKFSVGNLFKPAENIVQQTVRSTIKATPKATLHFTEGVIYSANKTGTALYHGTKGLGKAITQKDPNHILGRSINPIAGDLMILGAGWAGIKNAQRGARLNVELGSIDVAPVEGTMADYYGMGEEGAANSPYSEQRFRKSNIEHFGTNNNLGIALAMHYQRHNGPLRNGLNGMGVI